MCVFGGGGGGVRVDGRIDGYGDGRMDGGTRMYEGMWVCIYIGELSVPIKYVQ